MNEKIWFKLAHMLPKKLVYFTFIRFWAFATSKDEGARMHPDEMTWSKAMEIWGRYNK